MIKQTVNPILQEEKCYFQEGKQLTEAYHRAGVVYDEANKAFSKVCEEFPDILERYNRIKFCEQCSVQ